MCVFSSSILKKNLTILYYSNHSPFRTNKHIDRAINKVLKYKAEGLISVSSTNNKEKNYFFVKKGYLSKITKNINSKLKKFQFNGAIYIIKTNLLKKNNLFLLKEFFLPFVSLLNNQLILIFD